MVRDLINRARNILRIGRRYVINDKNAFQEFLDLNFQNARFFIVGDFIFFKGECQGYSVSLRYSRDVQVGTIWLDLEFIIVDINSELVKRKELK